MTLLSIFRNFILIETLLVDDKDPPWLTNKNTHNKRLNTSWTVKVFWTKILFIPPLFYNNEFVTNFIKALNFSPHFFENSVLQKIIIAHFHPCLPISLYNAYTLLNFQMMKSVISQEV